MVTAEPILHILREIRNILLPHWGQAEIVGKTDGRAFNVVTKLDTAVEEFTCHQLQKIYPDITFVGEENGGNREAERFWLMDPIDGTGHFIRGLPLCTSMLALIEEGQVTFGAVYDFLQDKMYWAQKGQGAFCDTARLQVASRTLKQSYLACETDLNKKENHLLFRKLQEMTVPLTSINAGWELAMVAAGKLDGRICCSPFGYDYDYAPGTLLIAEAGGVVANLGVKSFDYRNLDFIAASPTVFAELTEGPQALFPIA
jgi:myo-inositol-1(or 4)-monophosphatase